MIKRYLFCFFLSICLLSCEEVIDIDLPENEPRLVVDALIRIDRTQPLTTARVKVSLTSGFFEEPQPAELKQIVIFNETTNGSIILLETEPGSGIYEKETSTEFLTQGEMLLLIDWRDELFLARTNFVPSVPINSLREGNGFLFDEDDTEIIINFTDDGSRNDFYIFDFNSDEFITSRDDFYQGQEFEFSYFLSDLEPGDEVEVGILGADQSFYNYMNVLLSQLGDNSFGPFQTPVSTIRGNINNVTDIDNIDNFDNVKLTDNFALGYFAITETFTATLTVE